MSRGMEWAASRKVRNPFRLSPDRCRSPYRHSSSTMRGISVILFGIFVACQTAPTGRDAQVVQLADSGAVYVPGAEWRTASPAAAGFDAARIEALERDVDAGRYGSMHGVLVVRYGHLVLEHYSNGWSREQAHTMQSVTKSVTSLLFGIVNSRNTGATLDRPVVDVFSRYTSVANVDDRKRALTLRHLLTMRTSMDFWEQPYAGSPLLRKRVSSQPRRSD